MTGGIVGDGETILLKVMDGTQQTIARKQIKERKLLKTSLMPSVANLGLTA
jgi:hypothetical protein